MSDPNLKQRQAQIARSRQAYKDLFGQVSAILFRHDPIGINFETNRDEYDPEAGTILPRLHQCHSAEDVHCVIVEEICAWFGPEYIDIQDKLKPVANEVWDLWLQERGRFVPPTP